MSVREAVAGDAVALAALMTELGYPSSTEQILDRLRSLPQRGDLVLVAESRGEVVGAIHLHRADTLASGRVVEILAFVVHEPARGAGHGRALLDAGIEWADGTGAREMRVRARTFRTQTHAFYRDHGFRQSKEQYVFVRPLAQK